MVVLRAATSRGLSWEVSHLFKHYQAQRVLVILPNTKRKYRAFTGWANELFPSPFPESLPPSRLLYFDAQWVPIPLPNKDDNLMKTLLPFFRGNGIQIPN